MCFWVLISKFLTVTHPCKNAQEREQDGQLDVMSLTILNYSTVYFFETLKFIQCANLFKIEARWVISRSPESKATIKLSSHIFFATHEAVRRVWQNITACPTDKVPYILVNDSYFFSTVLHFTKYCLILVRVSSSRRSWKGTLQIWLRNNFCRKIKANDSWNVSRTFRHNLLASFSTAAN